MIRHLKIADTAPYNMQQLQGIDIARIEAWCAKNPVPWQPPLRFTPIAGGHSNLTYRVDDANGLSFALRRPPLGDLPYGAHDVAREFRILKSLGPTAVPVPRVDALCTDLSVIGAPFYVMRWIEGLIIDRPTQVEAFLPGADSRRRAACRLVDAMAHLHRVDVDAVGLGELGPRIDYLPRQLKRMRRVWEKTKTRELPVIDSLHQRLAANCPPQRHTGLVHSDFRFGNIILSPDGVQVAAVLDWELCALGDVLVDIAFLLSNWDEPDDPWPDVWMQPAPTRAGGFPAREEILARYAHATGFDVSNIDYYQAFCYWRIAVIAEGMKRRYESGAMSDQNTDLGALERRVQERAEMAELYLSRVHV